MSSAPSVNANIQGTTHQVNLRDYLNVRIAPFLKKALHESLDAEAQYPLQWLGEHLIQQSMIHEGNPDASQIRERFVYDHSPKPAKNQAQVLPPTSQTQTQPRVLAQPPQQPQQQSQGVVQPVDAQIQNGAAQGTSGSLSNGGAQQPIQTALPTDPLPSHDTEMGNAT